MCFVTGVFWVEASVFSLKLPYVLLGSLTSSDMEQTDIWYQIAATKVDFISLINTRDVPFCLVYSGPNVPTLLGERKYLKFSNVEE